MSSQETDHVSPTEVTPELGKGALDTCRRVHSLTMANVSRSPPIMPDGQISRVRFETLACHP